MSEALPGGNGNYAVERELGRGGGGVVYLAHDPDLGRKVAIKAVPPDTAADGEPPVHVSRAAPLLLARDLFPDGSLLAVEPGPEEEPVTHLGLVQGLSADR